MPVGCAILRWTGDGHPLGVTQAPRAVPGQHDWRAVHLLKVFRWDFGFIALVAIIVGFIPGLGWGQVPIVLILAVLEWSLSFDNAIVNATVLERMSPFWQKMFMTFGLAFAVGFMRLLFPILIVFASTRLG